MVRDSKVAHQPSKAEMEEDVGVNATPEALGRAVTRGGAEPREETPHNNWEHNYDCTTRRSFHTP